MYVRRIKICISEEKHTPGLLLADHAVVLADSMKAMQVTLGAFNDWAQTNGMHFGITKCGVMTLEGKRGQGGLAAELHQRVKYLGCA